MTKVLGLDLGSNSVGWALLEEKDGNPCKIVDLGCRIFIKAVEEKDPTPKNQKRRQMRLARRVLERRARRKQRMLNYLVSLDLLPIELKNNTEPEKLLNGIGDPYELRTKGLDEQLSPHELGRILLHFAARRGFLSSKKQLAGDLVDDPDTKEYLAKLEATETAQLSAKDKKPKSDDESEGAFKAAIAGVREAIKESPARTLGEYLYLEKQSECKRNRAHAGGFLRTDRAMYREELEKIWEKQQPYFKHLPKEFMADDEGIKGKGVKSIIFYKRPLKLKKYRVGRCSLEPSKFRANMARLEVQRFRYLQGVNHLRYGDDSEMQPLNKQQKDKISDYFERHLKITSAAINKELELPKNTKINLDAKQLKGNTTACHIREVIGEKWDGMNGEKQKALCEDLFTIKKKSALKDRLIKHWGFETNIAIRLCLLEFESGHSNLSLKAINKLLPYLEQGMIYSDARQKADYGYEKVPDEFFDTLPRPPETRNPIVNKGLHELKRVVNAIVKQYGKPDAIRIEMARDLEMNTRRVKDFIKKQKSNEKSNEEAEQFIIANRKPKRAYTTRDERIKYKLWKEQGHRCIYSNKCIAATQLFSSEIEIDHIVPKSLCLDDSYNNKVVCFAEENRNKGQRTPIDAWGSNEEKWQQITKQADKFYGDLPSKKYRKSVTHPKKKKIFMREAEISEEYGMSAAQLNDTRYISVEAKKYVKKLGCDVSVTKGAIVAEARHWWGFNSLLGETNQKERTDHRHHAIDAVVIACIDRQFHTKTVHAMKKSEKTGNKIRMEAPYPKLRSELDEKLKHIIVSHTPQRKLSGALHKKTGAGYIAKHGGLVYRRALNDPLLNPSRIVDETVRSIVQKHIEKYDSAKAAFAEGITVYHKVGKKKKKTPIKRVRVLQSEVKIPKNKNPEDVLSEKKFGVKDKSGKIFKWMKYGNTHHVEIIRHKETEEIEEKFVTMMEAHRRAMTGSRSARQRGVMWESIIKTDHGADYEFLMALHINDTVSIEKENEEREFYRVQKLDKDGKKMQITMHADAHKSADIPKDKKILKAISTFLSKDYKLKKHHVNAIGVLLNDQTYH